MDKPIYLHILHGKDEYAGSQFLLHQDYDEEDHQYLDELKQPLFCALV